jgi:hypothetical protein
MYRNNSIKQSLKFNIMINRIINLISSILMLICAFIPWAYFYGLIIPPSGFMKFVGIAVGIGAVVSSILQIANKNMPFGLINVKAIPSSYLVVLIVYVFHIYANSEYNFIWQDIHFSVGFYLAIIALIVFFMTSLISLQCEDAIKDNKELLKNNNEKQLLNKKEKSKK